MGATGICRFGLALAALLLAAVLPSVSRGQETGVTGEEPTASTRSADTAVAASSDGTDVPGEAASACSAVELDQQNLPVIDASDLVAAQLRETITATLDDTLREKLRQAYFRYLGCS